MTPDELHKEVSASFEGKAPKRFGWAVTELGHSYIELCKVPFLKWGEQAADIGKYALGIGVPLIALVIIGWVVSGSFL